MPSLCIKPACDNMTCVACNCAVPDKRDDFEAFVRRYWGSRGYAFPRDKAGDYVHADVMAMWRAWCAAICAHQVARVDVGEAAARDQALKEFAWTDEDQIAVDADMQCAWTQENDEGSDSWSTKCGNLFCLTEGSPTENKMRFCCYCGKALREFRFEGDE